MGPGSHPVLGGVDTSASHGLRRRNALSRACAHFIVILSTAPAICPFQNALIPLYVYSIAALSIVRISFFHTICKVPCCLFIDIREIPGHPEQIGPGPVIGIGEIVRSRHHEHEIVIRITSFRRGQYFLIHSATFHSSSEENSRSSRVRTGMSARSRRNPWKNHRIHDDGGKATRSSVRRLAAKVLYVPSTAGLDR